MRRVRYRVASSLDGYIAGPGGEIDWIVQDPAMNWASLFAEFDTVLLGRRTYELTRQPGAPGWPDGWRIYVFSRTLTAEQHPEVTLVRKDAGAAVAALRASKGKDIWLFGGGSLLRSLLEARQVDIVELAVMPVLLGGGVPFVQTGAPITRLRLVHSETSPRGIVVLRYEVPDAVAV
ncbi:MAG TPA: dihydrofolate reductase family protein [Gemmatimonadales bacterium]|nr:dihydrofolate reductase family protein [Gemmatimonadales bacterium]